MAEIFYLYPMRIMGIFLTGLVWVVCAQGQEVARATKMPKCVLVQWRLMDATTRLPLTHGWVRVNDTLWAETNDKGVAEICVPLPLIDGEVVAGHRGYQAVHWPIIPDIIPETSWVLLWLTPDTNGPFSPAWRDCPNDLPDTGWKPEKAMPLPCIIQDGDTKEKIPYALLLMQAAHRRVFAIASHEGVAEIYIPLELADELLIIKSTGNENTDYPILELGCIGFPKFELKAGLPPVAIPSMDWDSFLCEWDARPVYPWPFRAHLALSRQSPDHEAKEGFPEMECYGDLYAPAGMASVNPDSLHGWQFRVNQVRGEVTASGTDVIATLRTWLETDMALSAHSPLAPEHRGAYRWVMLPPTVYDGHPAWCIGYSAAGVEGKLWMTASGGIIRQDESRQSGDSLIKHVILNAPWYDFRMPIFAEQEVITPAGATRTRIFLEDINLLDPEPVRGRLQDLNLRHPMLKYNRDFWESQPER